MSIKDLKNKKISYLENLMEDNFNQEDLDFIKTEEGKLFANKVTAINLFLDKFSTKKPEINDELADEIYSYVLGEKNNIIPFPIQKINIKRDKIIDFFEYSNETKIKKLVSRNNITNVNGFEINHQLFSDKNIYLKITIKNEFGDYHINTSMFLLDDGTEIELTGFEVNYKSENNEIYEVDSLKKTAIFEKKEENNINLLINIDKGSLKEINSKIINENFNLLSLSDYFVPINFSDN